MRVVMKKKRSLLITGFDPFGGESINPSWEAVKLIPDIIGDYEVHKMEIPTVFYKPGNILHKQFYPPLPRGIFVVS